MDSPGFVDEQPEDLPRLVGWQPSTANRAFLSQQVTQETRSRVALALDDFKFAVGRSAPGVSPHSTGILEI